MQQKRIKRTSQNYRLNRDKLINEYYQRYVDLIKLYVANNVDPPTYKYAIICGWTDKYNQYERFAVLTKIGIKSGDKVLDVGCGVGEFINYILLHQKDIIYKGVDINENYIKIARERFPDKDFVLSSVFDIEDNFDWAIASGIFAIHTNMNDIYDFISFVMTKLVNKGLSFNLLKNKSSETFNVFSAKTVLSNIRNKFPEYKIELVDEYLADDFTIYVKK